MQQYRTGWLVRVLFKKKYIVDHRQRILSCFTVPVFNEACNYDVNSDIAQARGVARWSQNRSENPAPLYLSLGALSNTLCLLWEIG